MRNDNWVSADKKEFEKIKKISMDAANNTIQKLKQNRTITLRVNENVLDKIKEKAKNIGIPYQTLINLTLYDLSSKKLTVKL
jgi:predicted DNA binding CopG/RHH family protein